MSQSKKEAEALARYAIWRDRPDLMVRQLWGIEPDPWQDDVLRAFPHHKRIAMKASKGVGKTALEAWLTWNFLLTRPHPKIVCIAIDGHNLRDNLWTELAYWRSQSSLLAETFEWTKTRIEHRQHGETWWASARTWRKDADRQAQSGTLAGLHAPYIMFVCDETGGMPSAIMSSADAALSSCIEGHIVQAGNPTHLSGPLYEAFRKNRGLWYLAQINGDPDNPKRSSRVDIKWAREQIEQYGADNPWVLVNVFGEFPPASINSLLGIEELEAAMNRYYREDVIGASARVLGVDVARFGDDASVICQRQGLQVMSFKSFRNLDSIQGAGAVARIWKDWEADAAMLDATGGYGAGWEDQLRVLNSAPIPINFSGRAHDPARFFNKRAEMYWDAAEWVKRGGALPKNSPPDLIRGLTDTTYSFKGDRIILEAKEQIKDRLGYSPDHADAFVLTFAEPIQKKQAVRQPRTREDEYNPYADRVSSGAPSMYADWSPGN